MIPEISNTTDIFLSFWAIFCPFTPLTTNKKTPGDIIILCMSTINTNSWDMECVSQFFFSFRAIFCPFTHLTVQKMKISKKWKKTPGDILHNCTKSYDYRLYCSWDMACDGCHCYFSFWAIFCTFTP